MRAMGLNMQYDHGVVLLMLTIRFIINRLMKEKGTKGKKKVKNIDTLRKRPISKKQGTREIKSRKTPPMV